MTTKWTWRVAYIAATAYQCVILFGGAWFVEMRARGAAAWFLYSFGFFAGMMVAWGTVLYLERTARRLNSKNAK